MTGALIVFVVAVSIVITYMVTVNRFLRSDENWNESTATPKPQPKPAEPKVSGRLTTARA